jgi:hypothetical protein
MQPGGERFLTADRGGCPGQHKEDGLESVLRIMQVTQNPPTHPQHQGTMTLQERGKDTLVAPGRELSQQVRVAAVFLLLVAGAGADVA